MSENLPNASFQNPSCGCCQGECCCDGYGDGFICDDCQLVFDAEDLSASFLDPDATVCGAPCDNYWHGPNLITIGMTYNCGTCALPKGHTTCIHWTGCEQVRVPTPSGLDEFAAETSHNPGAPA